MTTHHHGVSLLGRQHETRRVFWAAIGVMASVLCAVAMVGNVTWAQETNWFLFAFAGFGVVGFGTMAVEQWQEWPKGGEPAWTHWCGAIFWAVFGAYQAFTLIYQLFITESDPNWGVVAITPVLAVERKRLPADPGWTQFRGKQGTEPSGSRSIVEATGSCRGLLVRPALHSPPELPWYGWSSASRYQPSSAQPST